METVSVRMAQFVLKIEKLSHIMGAHRSQDLRSPSPITAPDRAYLNFVKLVFQFSSELMLLFSLK